jgi:hypothetical protein
MPKQVKTNKRKQLKTNLTMMEQRENNTNKRLKTKKVAANLAESCEAQKLVKVYEDLGPEQVGPSIPSAQFEPPVLRGTGKFRQASQMFASLLKNPRKLAGVVYRNRCRFNKVMEKGRCDQKCCERDPNFSSDKIGKKFIVDPFPDQWPPPGFEQVRPEQVIVLDREWIVTRPADVTECVRGTYKEGTKFEMFAHLVVCEKECLETIKKRDDFIALLLECVKLKSKLNRGKAKKDLSELYMCFGFRFDYNGKLKCYTFKDCDEATQDVYNGMIGSFMETFLQFYGDFLHIALGKIDPGDLDAVLAAAKVTNFGKVAMTKKGLHSQFVCSRSYYISHRLGLGLGLGLGLRLMKMMMVVWGFGGL